MLISAYLLLPEGPKRKGRFRVGERNRWSALFALLLADAGGMCHDPLVSTWRIRESSPDAPDF
jgi:hypothetical protein